MKERVENRMEQYTTQSGGPSFLRTYFLMEDSSRYKMGRVLIGG